MALKINVIVREDEKSLSVSKSLCELALQKGFLIDEVNPDFVFSVGGDGTFLKAVHRYLTKVKHIKFVGIHKMCIRDRILGFFHRCCFHLKFKVL